MRVAIEDRGEASGAGGKGSDPKNKKFALSFRFLRFLSRRSVLMPHAGRPFAPLSRSFFIAGALVYRGLVWRLWAAEQEFF